MSFLSPPPEDSYGANTSYSSSDNSNPTPMVNNRPTELDTAETWNARWKSRRRMAWLSLLGILLATIAIFFFVPLARLEVIKEVMAWFYMAMTSIVGFYMGATTWAYVKK